jgi:hypothetical protein
MLLFSSIPISTNFYLHKLEPTKDNASTNYYSYDKSEIKLTQEDLVIYIRRVFENNMPACKYTKNQ